MEPASDTDTLQLSEQSTPVFWTERHAGSVISVISKCRKEKKEDYKMKMAKTPATSKLERPIDLGKKPLPALFREYVDQCDTARKKWEKVLWALADEVEISGEAPLAQHLRVAISLVIQMRKIESEYRDAYFEFTAVAEAKTAELRELLLISPEDIVWKRHSVCP